MELELLSHTMRYQVEQLQQSLFPDDPEGTASSAFFWGKEIISFCTRIRMNGKTTYGYRSLKIGTETIQLYHRCVQQSYYDAALPHLKELPPWGALAGVRPTKISTRYMLEGHSPEETDEHLKEVYYITEPRRKLALECSAASVQAVALTEKQDVSVYVGIPFCPTRCNYCSFVSRTVSKKKNLLEDYLQALLQEIEHTGKLFAASNKTIRTLYVGGGTPTTLSAEQLKRLMDALKMHLDLSRCVEFTVEAGRPDTVTAEKLQVLKNAGVTRISINPQSMNDQVLVNCGRPHTAKDTADTFLLARNTGFDNINADLIAGLPGDDVNSFRSSLEQVLALDPENITVHTLALKKGADLFENRQSLPDGQQVSQMLSGAETALRAAGYVPYYLYRQKYMSGSFENVGWTKKDKVCLYNIYMMEELHSIVSLGGGGMSKVNLPDGKLERFHNPKFPEQYLEQFQKVLEQKDQLFKLLNKN